MKTKISYTSPFLIPHTLPHAEGGDSPEIFGDYVIETAEGLSLRSNCGATTFTSYTHTEEGWVVRGEGDYDGAHGAINAVWGVEFPPCEFGEVESSWGHFPTMESYELERRRRRLINGACAVTLDGLDALRRIQLAVTCAIRDGKIDGDAASLGAALAELSSAVGPATIPITQKDCEALCVALGFQPNAPTKTKP